MKRVIVDGVETWQRDSGRYDKDPVTGPLVAECLRRVAAGEGMEETRAYLNAELRRLNVTERIKGQDRLIQRDAWSFKKLLRNPFYAGKVIGGRQRASYVLNEYWPREREEWAICKDDHAAPLVDMPTWLKVQDRLDRQSRVGQNRQEPATNPLSGLLHCATCDRRLGPHHARPGATDYHCKICNLRRSEKKLARMLAILLADLPIDPGLDLAATAGEADATRAALQADLDRLDAYIQRCTRRRATLLMQRADAGDAAGDYDEALRLTDADREEARADRAKVESMLATVAKGRNLSQLGDHAATMLTWTQDQTAIPVADAHASLVFCIEKIVLDERAQTATVTWSPEMTLLTGQHEVTVACPSGRRG
jgi:hypothetical protein